MTDTDLIFFFADVQKVLKKLASSYTLGDKLSRCELGPETGKGPSEFFSRSVNRELRRIEIRSIAKCKPNSSRYV